MKLYTYKAKNGPSDIVEGKIYAATKSDAVEKLISKGFIPTFLEESVIEHSKSKVSVDLRALLGVPLKELIMFSKQLARLIRAGIPILRALDILSEETNDSYFSKVLSDISENIRNGHNLSDSLASYPKIFSKFYKAMVSSGESTGSIDKALDRVTEYYRRKYELISKVRSALAYPSLILLVGIFTLIFVFTNVIPKIIPLLENLDVKLPFATRALISISAFFQSNWFWVLLGLFIFVLILSRAFKNDFFKYYFSKFKLNLPVFGDIVFKAEMAQFSSAMSVALASGIPLIKAVNISLPVINEYGIIDGIKSALKDLESGGSFGEALKKSGIFPPFIYNIVKVGEESGDIEDALVTIADTYQQDCDEAIKVLTNLIEPIMVLLVGIVVGFIVMAVLLPILNLNIVSL